MEAYVLTHRLFVLCLRGYAEVGGRSESDDSEASDDASESPDGSEDAEDVPKDQKAAPVKKQVLVAPILSPEEAALLNQKPPAPWKPQFKKASYCLNSMYTYLLCVRVLCAYVLLRLMLSKGVSRTSRMRAPPHTHTHLREARSASKKMLRLRQNQRLKCKKWLPRKNQRRPLPSHPRRMTPARSLQKVVRPCVCVLYINLCVLVWYWGHVC